MSKHTPGHWRVQHPKGINHISVASDKLFICEIYKYPPTDKEAEANANLIAAAPELFDALHHVMKASAECGWIFGKTTAEKAMAAIAKAKGES